MCRYREIACFLLAVAIQPGAVAGQDGATGPSPKLATTTWGDCGDGAYRNPVLNGDFADSDVERDGDRWVMITSTNHLAPGMTILESNDLVNWRYLGHVWPRLSWHQRYDASRMDGYGWGVWAGDLVQRDGQWLCYQIDHRSGLYMSKAENLSGPWSEPVCLLKKSKWTDPAVYFDEQTHEAWLVANFGRIEGRKTHDIRMFRLNWAGDRLLDEGRTVYQGNLAEAAKIHRIKGRWHLMLIEWMGQGNERDRKQLCLRSTTDSIYGPYEKKIVFERESADDRSACQGSLVQTDDRTWWYYHQLVQNGKPVFHGRPQCLQPVHWVDGWPIIGEDVDGDGIGEPVWTHKKPMPLSPDAEPFRLQTSEEFDGPTLGPQWNWNHNPRDDRWSLTARPGWLRLVACRPIKNARGEPGGFWQAANTLSQRQLGVGKTTMIAKLDLTGMRPGGRAGICHHSGKYALLGIRVVAGGEKELFFNNNGQVRSGPAFHGETIFLRSQTDGDRASYSWSTDGKSWNETDWGSVLVFGRWRGNRPGVFHWNRLTDDASRAGYVDVDYFRYLAPRR